MARAALDAGVGALVDAPIATTLDEVEAVDDRAQRRRCRSPPPARSLPSRVRARARAISRRDRRAQARALLDLRLARVRRGAAALLAPPTSPGGVLAHDALDSLFYLVECFGTAAGRARHDAASLRRARGLGARQP